VREGRILAQLVAPKETEQALTLYGAAPENRESLVDAQDGIREAFRIAHDQYLAGGISNLDLLRTEFADTNASTDTTVHSIRLGVRAPHFCSVSEVADRAIES
jgi:hypothetical protein